MTQDHTNFRTIVSDNPKMKARLKARGDELIDTLSAEGFDVTSEDLLESDSFRIFVISGEEPYGDPEAELIHALPQIKKTQESRALALALADHDTPEAVAEAQRIAGLKPHERMSVARELERNAPPVSTQQLSTSERAERLAIVARQPLSLRISKARELGVAE